jgi:CobQ-like glutamine amidotransferase family enzyme
MSELHILYLYPNELNTYGDHGNALTLSRRIEWHDMKPVMHYHHPGARLAENIDIVIGGGGQDSAQADVQKDILKIGGQLRKLADANGIGIFNLETIGGDKRMIGNVMVKSDFGVLFGFENHSGQTFLSGDQKPFAKVLRGNGNNGKDKTEGARTNNVFGTYMHGPFLPNNPKFCDILIKKAATNKGIELVGESIDDTLVEQVRLNARRRSY